MLSFPSFNNSNKGLRNIPGILDGNGTRNIIWYYNLAHVSLRQHHRGPFLASERVEASS